MHFWDTTAEVKCNKNETTMDHLTFLQHTITYVDTHTHAYTDTQTHRDRNKHTNGDTFTDAQNPLPHTKSVIV